MGKGSKKDKGGGKGNNSNAKQPPPQQQQGNNKKKKKDGFSQLLDDTDEFNSSQSGRGQRKQRKKQHRHHVSNYHNTAQDLRLRESIEGDGSRTIIDMAPDGNCLFRSLADQLYADYGRAHADVRDEICDYLQGHQNFFGLFLDLDDEDGKGEDASDFADYVHTMRGDGEWGGNLELVAASRLYRRHIRVFSSNLAALTIEDGSGKPPAGPDLLVSYHDNDHYNSVREKSRGGKPPPPPIRTFAKQEDDNNNNDVSLGAPSDEADDADDVPSDEGTFPLTDDNADSSTAPSSSTTATTTTTENSSQLSSEQIAQEQETTTPHSQAKLKKGVKASAPCPCGSGLKYKKCCKEEDRREARRLRLLEQNGGMVDEEEEEEDEQSTQHTMEGKFRVLKI